MNDTECLVCGASVLRHLPRCPFYDQLARAMNMKVEEYRHNGGVIRVKVPKYFDKGHKP